jgi:hypothetical protein
LRTSILINLKNLEEMDKLLDSYHQSKIEPRGY